MILYSQIAPESGFQFGGWPDLSETFLDDATQLEDTTAALGARCLETRVCLRVPCPRGYRGQGFWVQRRMPKGLERYYGQRHLHFITCSCYRWLPLLRSVRAKECRAEARRYVTPKPCAAGFRSAALYGRHPGVLRNTKTALAGFRSRGSKKECRAEARRYVMPQPLRHRFS